GNVARPTLARMTFSAKFRASPTRMPAVWAMPSTIRLCGTIGKAGYRSCRCSSASDTFFTAVALVREVNSVNLSIQIQRIGGSGQWPVARGRISLATGHWPLSSHSRRRARVQLAFDVVHDRVDREQLAHVV